jgi:hypothetical protein
MKLLDCGDTGNKATTLRARHDLCDARSTHQQQKTLQLSIARTCFVSAFAQREQSGNLKLYCHGDEQAWDELWFDHDIGF